AKNIDPQADNETQQRCMAMMVANFRGLAASWYQDRLCDRGSPPSTLVELVKELRAEFELEDLQDRLRDELYNLRQSACAVLMEYVAIFRRICTQLCDMTERDKILWFQRGLRTKTREELQYRRCTTVTSAIQMALDFERAHSLSLNQRDNQGNRNRQRNRGDRRPSRQPYYQKQNYNGAYRDQQIDKKVTFDDEKERDPYDMEIDSAEEKRLPGACFNCGRQGHRAAQCRAPRRGILRNKTNYQQWPYSQTNQNNYRSR
ncbi:hypothetical protein THRCLA_23172, partial [Thraustotheca clavata]